MKKKILIFGRLFLFIFLYLALLFLFSHVFDLLVQINGPSMEPNLNTGEIWILNKFDMINRGDVIVFKKPGHVDFIKRIIALPGDEIMIQSGHVYLNNRELSEDYLKHKPTYAGNFLRLSKSYSVPKGEYVVMGDNRTNSLDSRYYKIGFIKSDWIEGTVTTRIWPII